MQVKLFDRTIEYENSAQTVEQMLAHTIEQVQNHGRYIHYFVVDGVDVYTDVYSYIIQRLANVRTVEVITMTKEQYAQYAKETIRAYIADISPDIEQLADEFYKGASSDTWQQFDRFLQALQLLHGAMEAWKDAADELKKQQIAVIQVELQEKLQQMLKALEVGDVVLIGDLICYEIVHVLEKIKSEG